MQWVGAYLLHPLISKPAIPNGNQLLTKFWSWFSVVTLILSTSGIWFWTVRRRTDKAKFPAHSWWDPLIQLFWKRKLWWKPLIQFYSHRADKANAYCRHHTSGKESTLDEWCFFKGMVQHISLPKTTPHLYIWLCEFHFVKGLTDECWHRTLESALTLEPWKLSMFQQLVQSHQRNTNSDVKRVSWCSQGSPT